MPPVFSKQLRLNSSLNLINALQNQSTPVVQKFSLNSMRLKSHGSHSVGSPQCGAMEKKFSWLNFNRTSSKSAVGNTGFPNGLIQCGISVWTASTIIADGIFQITRTMVGHQGPANFAIRIDISQKGDTPLQMVLGGSRASHFNLTQLGRCIRTTKG